MPPGKDTAGPRSALLCGGQFLSHGSPLTSETADLCFPSHRWCREGATWPPPPLRSHVLCFWIPATPCVGCAIPASLGRIGSVWIVGIKLPKGPVPTAAGPLVAWCGGTRGDWTCTRKLVYFGTPRSRPSHMAGQSKFILSDPLCHFV